MDFEATVPMKTVYNQEYQYPHFKAKLRLVVADMALPPAVRRVFIELCGQRYAGGRVSFVARNYASVEACEEKVYSLLDNTVSTARAVANKWAEEDSRDKNLRLIKNANGTDTLPPNHTDVYGVLPLWKRKESVISRRRKGVSLLPTGFSVTPLGLARSSKAVPSEIRLKRREERGPRPEKTPEQIARTEKRRQERQKAKAYRQSLAEAAAAAAQVADVESTTGFALNFAKPL